MLVVGRPCGINIGLGEIIVGIYSWDSVCLPYPRQTGSDIPFFVKNMLIILSKKIYTDIIFLLRRGIAIIINDVPVVLHSEIRKEAIGFAGIPVQMKIYTQFVNLLLCIIYNRKVIMSGIVGVKVIMAVGITGINIQPRLLWEHEEIFPAVF